LGFGTQTCSTLKEDDVTDDASSFAATSPTTSGSHRRGISGGGMDGVDAEARQVDAEAEAGEAISERCDVVFER
jgi:hypothetical protein